MANELKFTGKITEVSKVTPTKKGQYFVQYFTVHEERISENTKKDFGDTPAFELFGEEKINKFKDSLIAGNEVTVYFNISSTKFNEQYYTHLSPWKIEVLNAVDIVNPEPKQVEVFNPNKPSSELPF